MKRKQLKVQAPQSFRFGEDNSYVPAVLYENTNGITGNRDPFLRFVERNGEPSDFMVHLSSLYWQEIKDTMFLTQDGKPLSKQEALSLLANVSQ